MEIGNVVSNYFSFKHTVAGKYEKAESVINVDVVDFNSNEKYGLIISISTIEHLGFDEHVRETGKVKGAILRLIGLLADGGSLLIAVLLAYNPEVDLIVKSDEMRLWPKYFLRRKGWLNLREETSMDEAMKYAYGSVYPYVNSVAFPIYRKGFTTNG